LTSRSRRTLARASLLALAQHPNIDIRIYNPKTSVGTPLQQRVVNVATDLRGVNQRMHNRCC
jgi:cardiolipin synthase C